MDRIGVKLDYVGFVDLGHILDDYGPGAVHPMRRQECVCAAQADDGFKDVPKVAYRSVTGIQSEA